MALTILWSRLHARLYWTLLAPHLLILLSSRWGIGTAVITSVAGFTPFMALASVARPLSTRARGLLSHPRIAVRLVSVLIAGVGPTAVTMVWLARDGRSPPAERNLLWFCTLAAFILWTTHLSRIQKRAVASTPRLP